MKNDKKRVAVKCLRGKGKCKWYAYCAYRSGAKSWQLRKVIDDHNCSTNFNVKLMTSKWLSQRMEKSVRENPNMKIMDITDKVSRKWNVGISRNMAFRARAMAKDNIEGSFNEQYRRIYDYGHELLKANPGSTVKTKVEKSNDECIFNRIYVCLKACKDSFISCRPIIGLDGCFLKARFWSRSRFTPRSQSDTLVNNMCEGFSSVLVRTRCKPIITMLEDIRVYIMKRWATNRTKMTLYQGFVCPKVLNRFQKQSWLTRYWLPRWSSQLFEVLHISQFGEQYVVNLENKECSCRKWLITGIPCTHAITAMKFLNLNAEDYISHWFRKSTYEETYNTIIYPING
ncbi:uncharacterized protein LOC108332650 [Vigna angularis]|uniref:uncharacterized protein LOC108332650 n=1 Tax=Phaseolus angularis TaxID=3914 RepID=UPI00080A778B|nr:uncharacterized protein LOC108332650 [Vigna angularis]